MRGPSRKRMAYNSREVSKDRIVVMVLFEGDRTIARPLAEVWAKLTDARFLVKCIPDVESVGALEPDHAALVLRPSLVFMRGTLDVDLRIADVVATTSARVVNHSKG